MVLCYSSELLQNCRIFMARICSRIGQMVYKASCIVAGIMSICTETKQCLVMENESIQNMPG